MAGGVENLNAIATDATIEDVKLKTPFRLQITGASGTNAILLFE